MGLDGVEIVMKVEETFDITISDNEAEKLVTPGHLSGLVMGKVGRTDSEAACLTQRAFHRVRKSLMSRAKLERRHIAPDMCMSELLPTPRRLALIREVMTDLGIEEMPEFDRPRWLVTMLMILSVAIGVTTGVAIARHPIFKPILLKNLVWGLPALAGIIALIFLSCISAWLTQRNRTEFKPSMATVCGFSRWVVAHGPKLSRTPTGQWSREQVSVKIREIVIDNLDCEKNYGETANFVKDLGLS